MFDIFPFPNIVGDTPEEQIANITNYLIQFKETLEFMLTNISSDNLSKDLVDKLNSLGADIVKNNQEKDDQLSQVVNQAVTVSDVINSPTFKLALENIVFSVNFATGELEYNYEE